MEKQSKSFNSMPQDAKPLVMLEFITEDDGLIFTYEDVKNAESNGYTKGFSEGIELGISQGELKAIREVDTFVSEIIVELNASLKEISELEKVFFETFFPSVVRTCLTVLQKAMPHFFLHYGREEMENLLRDVIHSLIIRAPIQVKISEQIHEHIVVRLHDLCTDFPETIEIIKSPELNNNACEIEWAGGGAKWNLDTRYQEIESKLQDYLKMHAKQGDYHG
jgi:flagellar biosynthesis/type III secretory pathway protein FliH